MSRLCYLVCDGCQKEYGRQVYASEDALKRDAAADGWEVAHAPHFCQDCVRKAHTNIELPPRPPSLHGGAALVWE